VFADEKIEIEEIERERLIDTYIVADANCVLFYLVVCRMLIHFIILFVGWFVLVISNCSGPGHLGHFWSHRTRDCIESISGFFV